MKDNFFYNVYIASYTSDGGIYHYLMDSNANLTFVDCTKLDRPMYMTIYNNKMYVIVREAFENGYSGVVTFDIDNDGKLINKSQTMSTYGKCACHILVNEGEVYCTNYLSGSVIKMPDKLVQHTGSGANPARQDGPHTHFVGITPDKKYVCVTDLGLDSIFLYDTNMNEKSCVSVPKGHGVRHLKFSDDGKYLFAVNELKSTVSVFSYEDGKLELIDTESALPSKLTEESTAAAIRVHDEKIYVSNRGHDSISEFSFKQHKLTLLDTVKCGGKSPRDFDFVGNYVISTNQDSDDVTVLKLENDKLILTDIKIDLKAPLCVVSQQKSISDN